MRWCHVAIRGVGTLTLISYLTYLLDIYLLESMTQRSKDGRDEGETELLGNAELPSTTNAMLGLLSLGPATGYELRQLIEGTVGNFWKESFGQIYPSLRQLIAEDLAEILPESLSNLRDRLVTPRNT